LHHFFLALHLSFSHLASFLPNPQQHRSILIIFDS
jgi:hypothetical protein